MDEKKVELLVVIFCIGLFVLFLFLGSIRDVIHQYRYEQVVVSAGDTFWKFYQDGYYADLNYNEALYEFKKDNNTEKSTLYAGDTIWLRKEGIDEK